MPAFLPCFLDDAEIAPGFIPGKKAKMNFGFSHMKKSFWIYHGILVVAKADACYIQNLDLKVGAI